GMVDSATPDSGMVDTGLIDTGLDDTGLDDTGLADIGAPDTGTPDTGTPDAGTTFRYTPSNFDPAAITAIAGPEVLNCGVTTFNSTSRSFTNWCGMLPPTQIVTQPGGPDAVVIAMGDFTIAAASTFRVVGTRPVIIALYGSASISGTINAGA